MVRAISRRAVVTPGDVVAVPAADPLPAADTVPAGDTVPGGNLVLTAVPVVLDGSQADRAGTGTAPLARRGQAALAAAVPKPAASMAVAPMAGVRIPAARTAVAPMAGVARHAALMAGVQIPAAPMAVVPMAAAATGGRAGRATPIAARPLTAAAGRTAMVTASHASKCQRR
jgi:hypothetical protein